MNGLSPLAGFILLLMITIVIVGSVYFWFTKTMEVATSGVSEQLEQQIKIMNETYQRMVEGYRTEVELMNIINVTLEGEGEEENGEEENGEGGNGEEENGEEENGEEYVLSYEIQPETKYISFPISPIDNSVSTIFRYCFNKNPDLQILKYIATDNVWVETTKIYPSEAYLLKNIITPCNVTVLGKDVKELQIQFNGNLYIGLPFTKNISWSDIEIEIDGNRYLLKEAYDQGKVIQMYDAETVEPIMKDDFEWLKPWRVYIIMTRESGSLIINKEQKRPIANIIFPSHTSEVRLSENKISFVGDAIWEGDGDLQYKWFIDGQEVSNQKTFETSVDLGLHNVLFEVNVNGLSSFEFEGTNQIEILVLLEEDEMIEFLRNRNSNYSDVLVVVNNQSQASIEIGNYYIEKHPDAKIMNISTTVNEKIDFYTFNETIRKPIEDYLVDNGLVDEINYIVLTKGVPLKIDGPMRWYQKSVDSLLTLILGPYSDRIESIKYTWNPYRLHWWYEHGHPFSREKFGIYLVTRLDGYTVDEVKHLIDLAIQAPGQSGVFVLDERTAHENTTYTQVRDILLSRGFDVIYDDTDHFLTGIENVLGYYSLGSNHGGDYHRDKIKNVNMNYYDENDFPNYWAKAGEGDIKVIDDGNNNVAEFTVNDNYVEMYQNFTPEEGIRYVLWGCMKTNITGKGVELFIREYDENDNLIKEKTSLSYNGTYQTAHWDSTLGRRTWLNETWICTNDYSFEKQYPLVIYEPEDNAKRLEVGVRAEGNGSALVDVVTLLEIKPHNTYVPGALAETEVSTSARTFNYPPINYFQSLIADLIREGVSGAKGYVYEPGSGAVAHPILFSRYLHGFNMAESFYMSSNFIAHKDVIVGDPKMHIV